jgi:hypothetical protein
MSAVARRRRALPATTARARTRAARGAVLLDRFGLFAECLLTGLWFVLAALPLVTVLPAFAAACGHLRRHLAQERSTWRDFAAEVVTATRTGWLASLLWWGGLALFAFDLAVVRSGALPGDDLVGGIAVVGMLAVVVVGLRSAAAWRAGHRWRDTVRSAARRCVRDLGGSLLLTGGLAVVAVAAWQMPALAVPALGCLAAAAVAVERRLPTTDQREP